MWSTLLIMFILFLAPMIFIGLPWHFFLAGFAWFQVFVDWIQFDIPIAREVLIEPGPSFCRQIMAFIIMCIVMCRVYLAIKWLLRLFTPRGEEQRQNNEAPRSAHELAQTISSLQTRINELTIQNSELSAQIQQQDTNSREVAAIQSRLNETIQELRASQAQVLAMENHLNETTRQLRISQSRVLKLESLSERPCRQCERLDNELRSLTKTVKHLESDNKCLRQENQRSKSEKKISGGRAETDQELSKTKQELSVVKKIAAEKERRLCSRVKILKSKLKRSSASEKKISGELAETKQQISGVKKIALEKDSEVAILTNKTQELETKLQAANLAIARDLKKEKQRIPGMVKTYKFAIRKEVASARSVFRRHDNIEFAILRADSGKAKLADEVAIHQDEDRFAGPVITPRNFRIQEKVAVVKEEPRQDDSSKDKSVEVVVRQDGRQLAVQVSQPHVYRISPEAAIFEQYQSELDGEAVVGEDDGQLDALVSSLNCCKLSEDSQASLAQLEGEKKSAAPHPKTRKDTESQPEADDGEQRLAEPLPGRSRSSSSVSEMTIESASATEDVATPYPAELPAGPMESVDQTLASIFETNLLLMDNIGSNGPEPAKEAVNTVTGAGPVVYPDINGLDEMEFDDFLTSGADVLQGAVVKKPEIEPSTGSGAPMEVGQFLGESEGEDEQQEQQDADMPLPREAVEDTAAAREKLAHEGDTLRELLANQNRAKEASATAAAAAAETVAETNLDEESEGADSGENNVDDDFDNNVQEFDSSNLPLPDDSDSEDDRHFGRPVRHHAPSPPSLRGEEETEVPDQGQHTPPIAPSPLPSPQGGEETEDSEQGQYTPPNPGTPIASSPQPSPSDTEFEGMDFEELDDEFTAFFDKHSNEAGDEISKWSKDEDDVLYAIIVQMLMRLKDGYRMSYFGYDYAKEKSDNLVGYLSVFRRGPDLLSSQTSGPAEALDGMLQLISREHKRYDRIKDRLIEQASDDKLKAYDRGELDKDKDFMNAMKAYKFEHEHELCTVPNFAGTRSVEGTLAGDLTALTGLSVVQPTVRELAKEVLTILERRWGNYAAPAEADRAVRVEKEKAQEAAEFAAAQQQEAAKPEVANRPKKAPKSRRQQ